MWDPEQCCGVVMTLEHEGFLVCMECGRVGGVVWVTPTSDYKVEKHEDSDMVKSLPRAAFPCPEHRRRQNANFDSILEQYLGAPQKARPARWAYWVEKVMEGLSMEDRGVYREMKLRMKQLRRPDLYPFIFRMVYDRGGRTPREAELAVGAIRGELNCMERYHHEQRDVRTSLPCAWMLLDWILRYMKMDSYYELPTVGNRKAYDKVVQFIQRYEEDVVRARQGQDPLAWYQRYGVWPV
jgi:hypothetical protein